VSRSCKGCGRPFRPEGSWQHVCWDCWRGQSQAGQALRGRIQALAEDVGRLRRRVEPDTYDAFLAFRIAGHVEALDALAWPTAAELYRECVDVDLALELVDEHAAKLHRTLGD